MNVSTSTTIHIRGTGEKPTYRIIPLPDSKVCTIDIGTVSGYTSFFIDDDVETLQEWAREFMHVANALFRMSLDKEGSEYDKGLPATDIAAHPELEVAAAMEVEF